MNKEPLYKIIESTDNEDFCKQFETAKENGWQEFTIPKTTHFKSSGFKVYSIHSVMMKYVRK